MFEPPHHGDIGEDFGVGHPSSRLPQTTLGSLTCLSAVRHRGCGKGS